jgi:HEAT repeat protein
VGGLLVVAWACGGPGVQTREPPHRPSDGLLADPGLQAVVADQVRRDGGALIGRLSDPRPAVRARAAFALGSVQAPEALGPLVAAIADSAAAVRRDVAFALGQLGAAEAVAPLADAFARETDDGVRARILEAFGKIGTVGSADALMGVDIRGGLEAERTLALAVLGAVRMVRTPAGEEHLLACLDDPLPRVREAAAYYFGRVPTPEAWAGHATRIREALDGYARDDPAAMYLVQALGRLDDPFDGERLRAWATSARDWRIRANAMTAIGGPQLGPEDRAVLHAGLGDRSAHVALAAALTLARTGVGPDEERRIEAWIDGHPDRWQVIDPLLSLLARSGRADFVLGWIDALPPDDTVRAGVGLRALGVLPGDAARERLARVAASESPRLAADAVGALARRWSASPDSTARSSYLGVFSRALRSGSVRAAYEAAPALADPAFVALGGADTLAAAYASMSTPRDLEAMQALLAALGATGSPRAAPILQAASNHGDPAIRRAAAEALASLSGQGAPGSSVSGGAAGDTVGGDPSPGIPVRARGCPSPRARDRTGKGGGAHGAGGGAPDRPDHRHPRRSGPLRRRALPPRGAQLRGAGWGLRVRGRLRGSGLHHQERVHPRPVSEGRDRDGLRREGHRGLPVLHHPFDAAAPRRRLHVVRMGRRGDGRGGSAAGGRPDRAGDG